MRLLAVSFALVLLLVQGAFAQVLDTTPPVLREFTISPLVFDATVGDAALEWCATVADEPAGVASNVTVQVISVIPPFQSFSEAVGVNPPGQTLVTVCGTTIVSQFAALGEYFVSVSMRDTLSNQVIYRDPLFGSGEFFVDLCQIAPCRVENRSAAGLPDSDNDSVPDDADNCPDDMNTDQSDVDLDLIGDVCDPFPFDRDNEKAQCFEDLTQAQDDLAACEARPALTDTDGDGEEDSTDACPDTPMGAVVDQGGCSQAQFCALVDASTPQGRRECRASDWGNDQPLARPGPGDCEEQGGLCVPAAP